MYQFILVTLDRTPTDRVILDHVKSLATAMHSRVVLLHVATGAPAKFLGKEAAGAEVEESRRYLESVRDEFTKAGIPTGVELACGEPVKEIVGWVQREKPDLVAMGTHGHQFMADLVLGTTAIHVQHSVSVPVLMLRAK
jgi:manganese transport protein